jgi:NAD(P)-dependent dehydrogenase (short-subunit alcohol dehydrogenase family)
MDASKLMFRNDLLRGEKLLVTGGGTGLGREMAEAFLALGADVVICGRRQDVLERTAQELTDVHGGQVTPIACDIRSEEAIGSLLDTIWPDGPLTGLVNNAAGNFVARTQDLSVKGFDAIANTVLRGSFMMTLDVGKRWIDQGRRGNVLSILATFVWNGSPFTVPSAMSKAGINVMTQSLAVEWARYGLRFNAICPGPFPTQGAWSRLNPQQGEKPAVDPHAAANPMGRVGEMHELCNLAVLLMAPGANYINGETIAIDGAAHLATPRSIRLSAWTDEQWEKARSSIRATDAADKSQRVR